MNDFANQLSAFEHKARDDLTSFKTFINQELEQQSYLVTQSKAEQRDEIEKCNKMIMRCQDRLTEHDEKIETMEEENSEFN